MCLRNYTMEVTKMSKKIYLSPSNQPSNIYCVGDTNEKVQMEDIAKRVKAILDAEYDCETVMATISLSIGSDVRPKKRKQKAVMYILQFIVTLVVLARQVGRWHSITQVIVCLLYTSDAADEEDSV